MTYNVTSRLFRSLFMLGAWAMPLVASASCPSIDAVDAYVEDFHAKRPNATYTQQLTTEQLKCARSMLISRLMPAMGGVVGYKVAFSSDELRGMYGFDEPIWGAMFSGGLTDSPARIPASYGAGRWWESALVFRIRDARLADAKTPIEALRSIDSVMPFIELTDAMSPNIPKHAHYFGNNANFRAGVLGKEITVKPTRQTVRTLANVKIVARDQRNGTVYHQVHGKAAMGGNPLHAAMWLAKSLQRDGVVLKKGDLLSISGITAGVWAQQGQSIVTTYAGLPGNPIAVVDFE